MKRLWPVVPPCVGLQPYSSSSSLHLPSLSPKQLQDRAEKKGRLRSGGFLEPLLVNSYTCTSTTAPSGGGAQLRQEGHSYGLNDNTWENYSVAAEQSLHRPFPPELEPQTGASCRSFPWHKTRLISNLQAISRYSSCTSASWVKKRNVDGHSTDL
ncbi:unnamed protein product [Pleuronectes platessa]|uniref:Uncharacterized protein n=1 Tax=Pleuronectes platessa TaxID=8262 RepID=A0A9N7UJF4_PLEPL|nr:unnamed protein product [Pleuronectes platessa]